jgi:Retrotransposon gag protein
MGDWIDGLNPLQDDYKIVWTQFQQEFHNQFTNSQQQQHAHIELDNLKMRFPDVDQYIAKFEDLVQLAGYTIGNKETINLFLHGLTPSILDNMIRLPFVNDYVGTKERVIQLTKARQMTEAIKARRGIGSQCPFQRPQGFQNFFGNSQRRPQYSSQRNTQLQRSYNQQPPQYNSSNAPRQYNNIPVPMDTSVRFRAPYN